MSNSTCLSTQSLTTRKANMLGMALSMLAYGRLFVRAHCSTRSYTPPYSRSPRRLFNDYCEALCSLPAISPTPLVCCMHSFLVRHRNSGNHVAISLRRPDLLWRRPLAWYRGSVHSIYTKGQTERRGHRSVRHSIDFRHML